MSTFYRKVHVPIFQTLYLISSEKGLSHILVSEEEFVEFQTNCHVEYGDDRSSAAQAEQQLIEYFAKERTSFQVPLDMQGTPFQRRVWNVLATIPYGEVWSYADVAKAINNPKAVRAVGQANRANPIPIIVPCHRVIGKSGQLTGYAGKNVHIKEKLLQLEGINARNGMFLPG